MSAHVYRACDYLFVEGFKSSYVNKSYLYIVNKIPADNFLENSDRSANNVE